MDNKKSDSYFKSKESLEAHLWHYKKTEEMAKIGGWAIDLKDQSLTWSEEVYRIHEVPDDFVPNVENAIAFYDERSKGIIQKAVDDAINLGTSYDLSLAIITAKGNLKRVRAYGEAQRNSEGKVISIFGAFQDITELKIMENDLRSANQYNRSLIEASIDPLVTIDIHGKITDVNNATELITGQSREELIGTDFAECFTEPQRACAGYRQVFDTGFIRNYELAIKHKDGHTTPVRYNASVYKDVTGKIMGVFASARDITARNKSELELVKAKEKAETANIAKDQFLASISHEFRTPLNGMHGMNQLMATTALTHEQRDYLRNQENATGRLLRLVENLLTFIELDDLVSPPTICEAVNLEELIQESVNSQKRYYEDSPPEVRVLMPESFDKWVCVDTLNLHLAMDQLVDNAIKFSGNHPVDIFVQQIFEQGEASVRIDICDEGIGMLPENISGLCEDFATQEDAMHKSISGIGLGLSIAKKASARGRMKMEYYYDQPKGTHVSLTVPAQWTGHLKKGTECGAGK